MLIWTLSRRKGIHLSTPTTINLQPSPTLINQIILVSLIYTMLEVLLHGLCPHRFIHHMTLFSNLREGN